MIGAIAAALLLSATPEASADTPPARWRVQIMPGRCTLEGRPSEGTTSIVIDTVPGSGYYRLLVRDDALGDTAPLAAAKLTFDPGAKALDGLATIVRLSDGASGFMMTGLPGALLDRLANADTLTLAMGPKRKRTIAIPRATKASTALRRCVSDQLIEWGADPAQFAPGGKAPRRLKDNDSFLSDRNIMDLAKHSRRLSINDDLYMAIDATGRVEECHAVAAITEPQLEEAACAIVRGKRLFAPARDAGGAPARGVATFRIGILRRTS